MTDEMIIESYKKYCPNLKSADLMLRHEYQAVQELEDYIKNKTVKADDVIKAFKKANESNFLSGKVNDFQADIRWMCNPANIDKVNSGKYDNNSRSKRSLEQKPQSHNYKFDEIEKEQHQKNMAKLEEIRKDKDHQEWLEEYWYKKYPNMRSEEDGKNNKFHS